MSLTSASNDSSKTHHASHLNVFQLLLFSLFVVIRREQRLEIECIGCWMVALGNIDIQFLLAIPLSKRYWIFVYGKFLLSQVNQLLEYVTSIKWQSSKTFQNTSILLLSLGNLPFFSKVYMISLKSLQTIQGSSLLVYRFFHRFHVSIVSCA